tara:strand:+ start:468 stop:626 length:159 start_codon:yes stop_codon:yes gene_type:complete
MRFGNREVDVALFAHAIARVPDLQNRFEAPVRAWDEIRGGEKNTGARDALCL